ncbi:LytR/AlgR family response regulator transcription factor [Sphingobacterium psychroaquaticum]|uniref:Two component transcriptional regulator, LytTR family n=1 Tax=Sphingobacterium psychroaquaticum TaxID=561061 RepID=A0A1X7JYR8_9SPHI|nr:LytTR family DNA-binding domain-containing protein [Sphingobacterium psychroaquaticum]SMG32917.1 two component transcriptional regulator, LytTR family [Sphingobacterium psychroaquaticum]
MQQPVDINLVTKMKCLLVDDEPLAIEGLKFYAEKLDYIEIIGTCHTAIDAMEIINRHAVDLMFLDINMPDLSGVDFLETLKNPPLTIFTTAYSEHAIDGFRLNAVDYLLKPISVARFVQAAQRARALFMQKHEQALPKTNNHMNREIYLKQGNEYIQVQWSEILFIESMQNYIIVHFQDRKITVHQTMSAAELLLPQDIFFRTHKSFLINISRIERIRGNTILINGHEIPLSKHRREEFFQVVVDDKLFNK